MRKPAFEPCIPTASKKVPDRPDWIHEIKQDGYRLLVQRDHDQVKLITRNGHDWTGRYPWIIDAARRIRSKQFVLDGEACILGVDGVADFDDLHSQKHNDEVQLYAFDLLSIDGDDLRELPLHLRKNQLSRLLARRVGGVQLAPFEQGEIGPDLFKAACAHGLEGLVSKRRDRPYRAGKSPDWIKVKNPAHPAMMRVMEAKRKKPPHPEGHGGQVVGRALNRLPPGSTNHRQGNAGGFAIRNCGSRSSQPQTRTREPQGRDFRE